MSESAIPQAPVLTMLCLSAPAAEPYTTGEFKWTSSPPLVTPASSVFQSDLDNVHIILVTPAGEPITKSKHMLLQTMSEEQTTDFATVDAGNGVRTITNIGKHPWRVRRLQGTVKFKSFGGLQVQSLDFNGRPRGAPTNAGELKLAPDTVYYLVTRGR